MSSTPRRRMTMAVGATIAGAAIPIASAFTAWANTEITYDGIVIYDDFTGAPTIGSLDTGTEALSGTHNDWAIYIGPATTSGVVNDSATTDVNDFAYYQGTTAPSAGAFFGNEGAQITNATNSNAEVFGGGNAIIDPASFGGQDAVTNSTAEATNGGTALISNGLSGTTDTGDYAYATGGNVGSLANSSTVGEILDSNNSVSIANDTGFNPTTFEGGSAVDLANNSYAEALNPGSAANIEGGVVNGVPLSSDVPITGVSNIEPDGDIFTAITSNAGYVDGIPDATFFEGLFGFGGAEAFTADWTIVGQLFGL